ncbi:hypothetical protein EK904_008066, partial [Melospiza melodia maxima]
SQQRVLVLSLFLFFPSLFPGCTVKMRGEELDAGTASQGELGHISLSSSYLHSVAVCRQQPLCHALGQRQEDALTPWVSCIVSFWTKAKLEGDKVQELVFHGWAAFAFIHGLDPGCMEWEVQQEQHSLLSDAQRKEHVQSSLDPFFAVTSQCLGQNMQEENTFGDKGQHPTASKEHCFLPLSGVAWQPFARLLPSAPYRARASGSSFGMETAPFHHPCWPSVGRDCSQCKGISNNKDFQRLLLTPILVMCEEGRGDSLEIFYPVTLYSPMVQPQQQQGNGCTTLVQYVETKAASPASPPVQKADELTGIRDHPAQGARSWEEESNKLLLRFLPEIK